MSKWKTIHDEMDKTVEQALRISQEMQTMAKVFNSGGTVTYEQLKEISPGKPFTGLKGIVSHRVPSNMEELVILHVVMEEGSYFNLHDHDCYERVYVLRGETFIDDQRCHQGKDILFPPGQKHRLFSRPGCELLVVFRQKKPA